MTREEAITIIERLAHTEAKWPRTEDTLEALDMSLSALRPVSREQVEKVWGGEWISTGAISCKCSKCNKLKLKSSADEYNFCPHCMAAMTDEAVDMVMKRLEQIKCKN